jgi:precorrin isomerase
MKPMHIDRTRAPAAKARTLSRRTARRMRIAHNMAALLGVIAWGDAPTAAPALASEF